MGAPTQLSIAGGQDKYLHFKANAGFFDSQHISYEDFAIESVELVSQGAMNFNRRSKFKFMNVAELVCGGYIEVVLPEITAPASATATDVNDVNYIAWVHSIGIYIFQEIEFVVNNVKVDIHYPQFLDMWSRLTVSEDKKRGWNDMIGEVNLITTFGHNGSVYPNQFDKEVPQNMAITKPQTKIMLPLQFWFCKDYSQALPVGLLLFSDIYINVQFEAASNLYMRYHTDDSAGGIFLIDQFAPGSPTDITSPSIVEAKLYMDYVFLEDEARERLASKAIFYVINQVKTNGSVPVTGSTINYKLPFVMPVIELIFGIQEDAAVAAGVKRYDWWDRYRGNNHGINTAIPASGLYAQQLPDSPITNATLKIMASDRFTVRDWLYWGRYQPYLHHTRIPTTRGIFLFSFALYPEEHLASGAINLSHADNNYLNITFNQAIGKDTTTGACGIGNVTGLMHIYARNHNYIYMDGGYLTLLYNV
jgi:hypothetical protein